MGGNKKLTFLNKLPTSFQDFRKMCMKIDMGIPDYKNHIKK